MLTQNSPLYQRLFAWINERFPLPNALLFFILYLLAAFIGRFIATDNPIVLSFQDLVGCFVTWSFFLLLRILDEHKDYQLDCQNHPQRILQSGLIQLTHLKILAVICLFLQLGWSLYLDQGFAGATLAWFILMSWTALMTIEFFCGEWLTQRLTLYAFSHMLVMPLILWWLMQMGQANTHLTPLFILIALLVFMGGFSFEITRKTRAPEEERESVDSYSQRFGVMGASLIILVLLTLMLVIQLILLTKLTTIPLWIGLVLFFLMGTVSLISFMRKPTKKGRKINEAIVGLVMLGGNAVIIAAILLNRGIELKVWA